MDSNIKNTLETALFSLVKQHVINIIVSKLPILGSSLLSGLLSFFVGKLLTYAFDAIYLQIAFAQIDKRVLKELTNYIVANNNLSLAVTTEEKDKAEKELIDATKKFIKL